MGKRRLLRVNEATGLKRLVTRSGRVVVTSSAADCDCCGVTCTCPGTNTTLAPCCCIPIGQPGSCATETAFGQQCHCCTCGPGAHAGEPRDPCCCIPQGQPGSCQSNVALCRCSNSTCCSSGAFRLAIGPTSVLSLMPGVMNGGGDRRCQCVGGVVTEHVSHQCSGPGIVGPNQYNGGTSCGSVHRVISWSCSNNYVCPGQGGSVDFGPIMGAQIDIQAGSGTLQVSGAASAACNVTIPITGCSGVFPGCAYSLQNCLGSCSSAFGVCGSYGSGGWSVSNCEACGPQGAQLVRSDGGLFVPSPRSLVIAGGCSGCGGDGTGGALI